MSCNRVRSVLCGPLLFLCALLCMLTSLSNNHCAWAQAPPKPADPPRTSTKPPAKKPASKSPNVKTGEIVAIDPAKDALSVKESGGVTADFTLIEKTHYFKNKREAKPADFKAGEAVIVHIRHSRSDGEAQVIELTDKISWDWLDGIRHNTTNAKLKAVDDDTLTVLVGTESIPLTYTISDKTLWNKGGKAAAPTDFKAGDSVSIVPRSLPSGGIMASVVADSPQGAAQGKERKAVSIHGIIQALDAAMHTLTLKTEAGDTRILNYTDATEVHLSSKTLPLTSLKVGQSVGARIRHDDNDKEVVWSITLGTTGSSKSGKKATGSGKKMPS